MYKKFFLICILVVVTLTSTQFATADYRITNGSAIEEAWVAYSAWTPASGGWITGWRTQGWAYVAPGDTYNLPIPQNSRWVYIRAEQTDGSEIKPPDHATRNKYPFWMHPSEDFTVVMSSKGEILESNLNRGSLKRADLYKYQNGGSHTIPDDPRLPDLPARQIYNQAINSVVWIETYDGNESFGKGSGVLIDKARRLVVTNAHVIGNAEFIYVFFPWRNRNGELNKKEGFYFENWEWLESNNYASEARVISRNVRNDVAIIQLDQLSPAAREIQHDFSRNVEDSMRRGDTVHILGNPGNRLWNWTKGDFLSGIDGWCLPSGGPCLRMEVDIHGGNSGGPVLNGQGMLIGIITATDNETEGYATPSRNIKSLLDTLRPRHVFKIRNATGITMPYEIKWSNSGNWKLYFLAQNRGRAHGLNRENLPIGYPKIRFDYISGDGRFTPRGYNLDTSLTYSENNDDVLAYVFKFVTWNKLDLFPDAAAAPALPRTIPEETSLLSNYPNPSNPETWIPYKLAKPAKVTVTVYSASGRLIRKLVLGHQPAGVYQSKSRAAYWDGKNTVGEPVASGVYFYTLKAGDFTATRRMLIRK